jgi:bifunctional aspartokinase / homoserine dehydrogenase 1
VFIIDLLRVLRDLVSGCMSNNIIVHKFGGSSIATPEKIKNSMSLIKGKNEFIVVSAIGKTTSKLQLLLDLAVTQENFEAVLNELTKIHDDIINDLIPFDKSLKLKEDIKKDFSILKSILSTISLIKNYSNTIAEMVLGFGEILSAQIINLYLCFKDHNSEYINASNVIFINKKKNVVTIDWNKSQKSLSQVLRSNMCVYVVTGFIASNEKGIRTTLGLNGSDFSATIIAKMLKASKVIIWTDVSGVLSADPRKVANARTLKSLSYKEALELSYFGATVIHPQTISPIMKANIPLWIKSSLSSRHDGTMIHQGSDQCDTHVKALTSIEKISLINIQGAGLIGVSGISSRVFDVLRRHDIDVIMISQASSEYSLCFVIHTVDSSLAIEVLSDVFYYDIENGNIENIKIDNNCAIITAVGDGMIGSKSAAGRIFKTLSENSINIKAIAQGASERSISAVIKESHIAAGLTAIHNEFYGRIKFISIGIIGFGNIGKELIKQLTKASKGLFKQKVHIEIRAIMNSKKMQLYNELEACYNLELGEANDMVDFLNHIQNSKGTPLVIDLTASHKISEMYLEFMQKGINIITANKHMNAGSIESYNELRNYALNYKLGFFYETNVCAGLPVIQTIKNLVYTGDEVISIYGVFSGTLSYIFDEISKGKTFSESVFSAYDLGYTEPDPREDLSGMDVARKVVILAREIGLDKSLEDLNIQNLTPKKLQDCSRDEFLKSLPACDNQVLNDFGLNESTEYGAHYVGRLSITGEVSVGIELIKKGSPLVGLKGTDNIVVLQTNRYDKSPMIIKGPGAGAEVTAAGVFADILNYRS